METYNANGHRVSLLNDDAPRQQSSSYMSHAYATTPSEASSPTSPQLWRSSSYDSQMSGGSDAVSPLTPALDYTYSASSSQPPSRASNTERPLHYASSRSTSNEDELPLASQDRPAKRYPCRFRDSHGCEKTFTTSGHASRHSKIHTAEKAVQCTFPGCQKKFTRADNMKQHLETHYKDKSRAAVGGHRAAAHKSSLAPERRPVGATARSRSSSSLSGLELDVRQYALPTPPPLRSPTVMASGVRSNWEVTGATLPLHSRPMAIHHPKSGLDALAMAVACQERS